MSVIRSAVVTGASRGIGAAIALRLAKDGLHVDLISRRADLMQEIAERIVVDGGQATVHRCDLSDREAVTDLGRRLARDRTELNVLVNNAGTVHVGDLDTQERAWDEVMNVNLWAVFELTRLLVPSLRLAAARRADPSPSIVNIGSVLGLLALPGTASYNAAKGALHQLTRSLAVELGPAGVRVNALAPGYIRTEMFEESNSANRQATLAAAHPIGRVGSPSEVAEVVAFLCSSAASFVSGVVLPVDGGLSAKLAVPDL